MTGSHDHTHSHDHSHDHHHHDDERWKHDGVRVIPGNQLDPNVPSTAGMDRKAAINFARVGAQKLWAGTVSIKPDAKTGAHHHGHLESIIYVVKGKARMRWGEKLQFTAEAGPGDFIFVPPYVPHQEINANPAEVLECVLVRSDNEVIVIGTNASEYSDIPELPDGLTYTDIAAGHYHALLLRSDGMVNQQAGHAWAEAFVPDLGWIGFDAANGICTTDAHARVAIGLDYLGAAPVRGTRYGGGNETLTVAVKVDQAGRPGQWQSQTQS